MTIGKTNALLKLQAMANYAFTSDVRRRWLDTYTKVSMYKRGDQWLDDTLNKQVEEMGAIKHTLNVIKPEMDKYLSLIIRSAKKIGYSPTNTSEYDKKMSNILKYWAMNVLTKNQYSFYSQLKVEDFIAAGLGASEFTYKDGNYFYENRSPLECFPDPDDFSARLDNQNTTVSTRYVHVQDLIKEYPNHKKFLLDMVDIDTETADDYLQSLSTLINLDVERSNWIRGKSIRIVEVYYKKLVKYYSCKTNIILDNENEMYQEGKILNFETFDENLALEKSNDGKVEIKNGTRIYKGVYVENTLLYHAPIESQIPNQKYMPIIFAVYKRDHMGTPYGLIEDLIPRQDMKNLSITTSMHYKDQKVIINQFEGAGDMEKAAENVRSQLSKKKGVIFLPNVEHLQIMDNNKGSERDMSLLQFLEGDWQRATNLYDEFSGTINRETSGVAVQQLTLNSINTHNFLMLAYNYMITSEGSLMLDTLKGTKDINQVVKYYKSGEYKIDKLDATIAFLNFEVYPEVSANFSSTVEEEKIIFQQITSSNNPSMFLDSPVFLEQIGVSEETAYKWYSEWERVKIAQQQLAMKAQLEMQQMQMELQQNNEQNLNQKQQKGN